jgi:hypothetical protein
MTQNVYRSLDGHRWKAVAITAYADLDQGDRFVLVGENAVAVRGRQECPHIWKILCRGPIAGLAVVRLAAVEEGPNGEQLVWLEDPEPF